MGSTLQAGMLTVNWRGRNESTAMLMVFAEVFTGMGYRASGKVIEDQVLQICVESSTTHGVLEYSTRVCTRLNILIA